MVAVDSSFNSYEDSYAIQRSPILLEKIKRLTSFTRQKMEEAIWSLQWNPRPANIREIKTLETKYPHYELAVVRNYGFEYQVDDDKHRILIYMIKRF